MNRTPGASPSSAAGGQELRAFWNVLVRRRWVAYTVGGLVLAAGAARTFTAQPVYRAASLVEIQRAGPDVLAFRDVARGDPGWAGHAAFYETQYRILESRAVARRAASRLDLENHPLLARREPGPLRRLLSAARRLLPGEDGPAAPGDPAERQIAMILGALSVEPVRDSHLVEVACSSTDPSLSAQLANAVADAYIEFTLTSYYDVTEQASDFLGRRVGELRDEVERLESRLQGYRESRQILPSGGLEDLTLKGVSDIHSLHLNARATRIEREAEWRAASASDPASLPAVAGNAAVQQLREDVNNLELRRAELLRTFKPGWPEVETVTRRLEEARARLESEIAGAARRALAVDEARYRASLEEERRLEGMLNEQKTAAQRAGRDAIEHATLRAEVERKRSVLDALLQRQNETAVSSQMRDMNSGNARIVDRATPPRGPASPRPAVDLPVALLLGLFLGIAAAFAMEAWDNTLRSPEDIERILGLPTLASIPAAGEEGRRRSGPAPPTEDVDLMSHRESASPLAEAFRDLRTAISLSSAGEPPRRLAVTSTRPEEGKSTVALNLATVIAQSGRRTLLVDADLRRPRLHRALGLRNATGLSTLLCGRAGATEAIQPTGIPGLSLLPSGPVPPNPAELLDSPAFDRALDEIEAAGYETILLDSAPLLTVADAAILAARAGGTLLVVEADSTTRDEARRGLEKIRQGPARVLGAVLNNVVETATGYGRYRYRYRPSGSDASEIDPAAAAGGEAPARDGAARSRIRAAARRLGRRMR